MDRLPLNALRAFALACAHGGVRAAARELGVSHSSVSRYLAELEAWMGIPLVERDSGSWAPTPQGAELASRLQTQLLEMANAVEAAREANSVYSVTVGVAPSFATRWLLPRLPSLARAHPRVELSVLVNQRMDNSFQDVDLAIRMGRGPWPGLQCEPLMDELLYPVVSPPIWSNQPHHPENDFLIKMNLLHDRDPSASWEQWRRTYGPSTLSLASGARLASSDLVLRSAELGHGVALARGRLAEASVKEGTLFRPFGSKEVRVPNAYWIVRPNLSVDARARRHAITTVVAWLKEQAA